MTTKHASRLSWILLLLSSGAAAQLPPTYWEEYIRPYNDELLYVHSLINYAYDLEWRYQWERRQLASNAVQLTSGSVAADDLLDDMDININQPLNDKWRFQGRYTRLGLRQRAGKNEQLLLGMERSILGASGIYLMVNPQYQKEFMDIAAGYTYYKDDREQYIRVGAFFEDFAFAAKNREHITSEQQQVAIQWQLRLGVGGDWVLFSEGNVGNGFDRVYTRDAASAPGVARHERRENSAELRLSRYDNASGTGWAGWVEWYDFREAREFRTPGFDYQYTDTIASVSAEHIRVIGDRHRLRFLLHYVDQQAGSIGHDEHDYRRNDLLVGIFYEYLWPHSGMSIAYAAGQPDIDLARQDPGTSYAIDTYSDKIIAAWRYNFSDDARLRIAFSHEVVNEGFGGGSVQFQMFF